MLYNNAKKMTHLLDQRISSINTQLQKLPEGKLYCIRDGKKIKWYHYIKKKQVYLSKKRLLFAQSLAQKKYLLQLKEDLLHEKRALEFYLRHHIERPWKSEELLVSDSEFQKLLLPFFKPQSKELKDWAISPYSKNQNYPKQLIYKTPTGHCVRSKSEMLIAMTLFKYQIPFRYECALQLGSTIIYPDFTIRHPQTGELYYLEHFGMIDNPVYRQNTLHKLNTYLSHDIYPTINLIITYETKEHPLNLELLESIIQLYFL